ncbi:MAG TPA: alpha/beta fold hydrolase [Coxiellaceae bacterium]|nr:alpha/beta fold hydrolase [Coxiellaceae bacterium]
MQTPSTFEVAEKIFLIQGAVGQLEVMTQRPATAMRPLVAVICHPNPLQEGTMYNKVVTTIARAFNALGVATVRFNYRGVGKSEGQYGDTVGEIADTLAVLRWAKHELPDCDVWLAGFSFGTFIAARAATQWPTKQLVSIAPTVDRHDFASLPPVHCPWLVVQGEIDEVIDPQAVFEWAKQAPVKLITMPQTGHFFHGKLMELKEILVAELSLAASK